MRLRPADLALLLVCCAPIFWRLGGLPLWGSESRWLFIARHMAESGDALSLERDGEFYGDKPFLSYWAIAALAKIAGRLDEGVARLPSAIAAVASVLTTAWLGARFFERRTGLLAGAALATALGFLQWARTAAADLENVAFTTAAIAVYVLLRERVTLLRMLGFSVLLALGGQCKGLPAIVVPLAVAAADLALEAWRARELRALLPTGRTALLGAACACLGVVLYGSPFVLSYLERGDWKVFELVLRENVVRAVDPFDHKDEGPLFYVWMIPALLLPWGVWLPQAVVASGIRGRAHDGHRRCLLFLVCIFAVFTMSGSRRSYYILPALPWAAIVTAAFLVETLAPEPGSPRPGRLRRALARGPLALLAVTAGAVALYLVAGRALPGRFGEPPRFLPHALLLAAVCAGAAAFAGEELSKGRGLLAAGVLAAIPALYAVTGVEELRDASIVERDFATRIRERFPTETIASFGMQRGGPIRYYVAAGPSAETLDELRALAEASKGILTVAYAARARELGEPPGLEMTLVETASSPSLGSWRLEKERYVLLRCVPK